MLALLAILALLLAIVVPFLRDEPRPPSASRPHETPRPGAAATTEDAVPRLESTDAVEAPTSPPLAPPPVAPPSTAAAPRTAPPSSTGCEPIDDQMTGRPGLFTVLHQRSSELVDRLNADASPDESALEARRALAAFEPRAIELFSRLPAEAGVDLASLAIAHLGGHAVASHSRREAELVVSAAARLRPNDVAGPVIEALLARDEGDRAALRGALARAFSLAPTEPSISLAYAQSLFDSSELDALSTALHAYLEEFPEDAVLTRRARLIDERRTRLGRASITVQGARRLLAAEGVTVPAYDVLTTVDAAIRETAALLGERPRDELTILVYRSRDDLHASTCVQAWSEAVFDGSLHIDAASLASSTRAMEVVRHEATHAQLRALGVPLPVWIDEGLAQLVADEEGPYQRERWARMVASRQAISFGHLDASFQDIDDPTDAGLAYVQSLGQILWLRDRRGDGFAREIVRAVREHPDTDVLTTVLGGTPTRDGFLAFLEQRLAAR